MKLHIEKNLVHPERIQRRVKIYWAPGPGPSTWGENFFEKKRGYNVIPRQNDQNFSFSFPKTCEEK